MHLSDAHYENGSCYMSIYITHIKKMHLFIVDNFVCDVFINKLFRPLSSKHRNVSSWIK